MSLTACLHAQELGRADAYIERIEAKFGVRFLEGRNPDIEFMAHLWEPLRWIHKPLVVFLGAEAMGLATNIVLYAQGFRSHRHNVSPACCRPWQAEPDMTRAACLLAQE